MMRIKATATLFNGQQIKGWLTTDHAASSYGKPVFVDEENQAYNWAEITDITTTRMQSKGGKSTSTAKAVAARKNGRKGGRPRKKN